MNAFFNINKCLGVCFGITLLGVGIYKGLEAGAKARNQAIKTCKKQIEKRLRDCADDLPPGLNGEYPADGPLADYYRQHKNLGDISVRVGS